MCFLHFIGLSHSKLPAPFNGYKEDIGGLHVTFFPTTVIATHRTPAL